MSLSTSSFTSGCNSRHLRDSSSIFSPQNFERSREKTLSSPSLDHEAESPKLPITEASVGETSTSAIEMDVGVWRLGNGLGFHFGSWLALYKPPPVYFWKVLPLLGCGTR